MPDALQDKAVLVIGQGAGIAHGSALAATTNTLLTVQALHVNGGEQLG